MILKSGNFQKDEFNRELLINAFRKKNGITSLLEGKCTFGNIIAKESRLPHFAVYAFKCFISECSGGILGFLVQATIDAI